MPAAQGKRQNQPLDRTPSITGPLTYIHTNSEWDHADMTFDPICPSLGCGGKLEYPENPMQTWGENANSTQTVATAKSQFFPLSML